MSPDPRLTPVSPNEGHGSCIISARGDILAWNEGDQTIIEATIPSEPIRYWDGGDAGETTYLLRRPHVYEAFTKDKVLGPLAPMPADMTSSTLTP